MTTEYVPNGVAPGHTIVPGVITKHHVYKHLAEASARAEAADKLSIPWRIERVSVDIGFGNDALPAYEFTMTIPENWSKML